MVLSVHDIRVSRHKDAHPEDSDGPEDIGLSSEEEAEGMEENISIARKYHQGPGPAPTPAAPPAPRATSTDTGTSTTDPEVATLQVPVAALQQVQEMIGKILGGEAPAAGLFQPAPQPSAGTDQGAPFSIPKPKRGEKKCSVCLLEYHISETACEDPHRRAETHMPKSWMWQEIIFQKITGDPPADLPEGKNSLLQT